MQRFILFLVLMTVLAVHQASGACATHRCGTGLKCCDDLNTGTAKCYNSTQHVCVDSKYLCARGNKVCNGKCFNPSTHTCFLTLENQDKLCAKGQQICGNECYNPNQKTCNHAELFLNAHQLSTRNATITCGDEVCGQGESCCNMPYELGGPRCYNHNTESCCVGNRNPTAVCPREIERGMAAACCQNYDECYDRNKKFCCLVVSPGGTGSEICDAVNPSPYCTEEYCDCIDVC